MALDGIPWHHDIFRGIPLIGDRLLLLPLLQLHDALGVGKPGGGAHHHRRIVGFAQVEGPFRESFRLGAVRGLQHGNHGRPGHHPAVLLVLGAVHARIVRRHYHHSASHARVGSCEQRIGCYIHSHMLHGAHGTRSGDGSADGHLRRHLLIGGPLRVDLLIFRDCLADLRTGRARIGRRHLHARLVGSSRYGLVAKQYLLL